MKKILLTLFTVSLFGISLQVSAQEVTRYSEYSEDWTLDKQLFDLGNSNVSFEDYKQKTFKVAKFENGVCKDSGDFAEFGENFQGLGRIEIIGNNSNEATFWKFKPGKEFGKLENESFIEFCYGEDSSSLNHKIKIKRAKKALSLKTIGNGDQKKVVVAKEIGDNGTNIEISLRCEPNDVAFNSINTGETEEKFIISLKKLDLKTNNDEFKVKIEGNLLEDEIDTVDTFFAVNSDSVNANFYFFPEDLATGNAGIENTEDLNIDKTNSENEEVIEADAKIIFDNQSRSSKYISQYPDSLEMSLYKGVVSSPYEINNHTLIAKSNGVSLSTNLEIESQNGTTFSLVTKIKGSSATESIKVYTITKFGAKIISTDVFPAIAKSGSQIHFDIIANIFNTNSELDYAQIVFDDDRFEKLNLSLNSNSGTGENLSKELTFSGDYILPSDNSINGQFIGYEIYVILKDGTRTKLDGKKEIYVGTRDDICKDPKMCTLRGLKALKNSEKSAFEKVLIQNFDENEYDFTENDLYKVFRKQ